MPRMTYAEAMDRYGVDNPDLRFGLELVELSDLVKDCGFKVFADAVAARTASSRRSTSRGAPPSRARSSTI